MRYIVLSALLILGMTMKAQTYADSTLNSSTKKVLFANPNQFAIGSYGEAHYNQEISNSKFTNGQVDLHRVILFVGYKFTSRLQFFTEIEFEHLHELTIEQAYLNYRINNWTNFKAGVILIPMGVVNEFHEPTLFNGVERPNVDKYIIPSTWHEMGAGFHGIIRKASLKYQLYAVNGFNGYDGNATVSGSGGLRSARQGGGESVFRRPAFTGKLTFFGVNGLRIGLSGYYGSTESSLYNGLDRNNENEVQQADSSRMDIAMAGINIQYSLGNLRFLVVGNLTSLENTAQYNTFTGAQVGSRIMGAYGEIAYHQSIRKGKDYPKVIPFVRYENYDTHFAMEGGLEENPAYHREVFTAGLGFQITPGTIVKADFQWLTTEADRRPGQLLNVGFGYWF